MSKFKDGLGRILTRDPLILDNLVKGYQSTNQMILAQAGLEIECLCKQVRDLELKLRSKKDAAPCPKHKA